jgi:hypothetical protein
MLPLVLPVRRRGVARATRVGSGNLEYGERRSGAATRRRLSREANTATGCRVSIVGLEDLIARLVDERVAAALAKWGDADPWLDSAAAAEYIGVTRQRIHDLSSQGLLPRVGEKGQRLYYKRSTLDAYREGRAA